MIVERICPDFPHEILFGKYRLKDRILGILKADCIGLESEKDVLLRIDVYHITFFAVICAVFLFPFFLLVSAPLLFVQIVPIPDQSGNQLLNCVPFQMDTHSIITVW